MLQPGTALGSIVHLHLLACSHGTLLQLLPLLHVVPCRLLLLLVVVLVVLVVVFALLLLAIMQ
jgi:hypothetical protein